MEELKEYLDNHKGFRLTKEMIDKIILLVDETENDYYNKGWKDCKTVYDLGV